jgi:cobalamin synthase
MTLLAAVGYFAVIGAGALLDRLSKPAPGRLRTILATLARERWVWITPVVVVLALYLSVIFQPGQAETGPVMYALF